jgi:hypothetical protein
MRRQESYESSTTERSSWRLKKESKEHWNNGKMGARRKNLFYFFTQHSTIPIFHLF